MSPTSCQTAPPRARRNEDYSWLRKTVSTICDEKPQPAVRLACFKGVRPMIEFGAAAKRAFLLEPGLAFLNHGSSGALREAAGQLALFIRASPDDVVFVDNATSGVNTVLRALAFRADDEILATTHTPGQS